MSVLDHEITYRANPLKGVLFAVPVVALTIWMIVYMVQVEFRWVIAGLLVFFVPLSVFVVASMFGKVTIGPGVVTVRTAFKTHRFEHGQATASIRKTRRRPGLVENRVRVLILTIKNSATKRGTAFNVSVYTRQHRERFLAQIEAAIGAPIVGLDQIGSL